MDLIYSTRTVQTVHPTAQAPLPINLVHNFLTITISETLESSDTVSLLYFFMTNHAPEDNARVLK